MYRKRNHTPNDTCDDDDDDDDLFNFCLVRS
jgi:hypothetical protein